MSCLDLRPTRLNCLPFIQARQAGPFDGRDVNEDVIAAVLGLDEPVSRSRIEPLHRAARHRSSVSKIIFEAPA
jgi:hypothetical protein